MTRQPTGKPRPVPVGLAVRRAVAEALHPGELDRAFAAHVPYLTELVRIRWAGVVGRIGWEEAISEAMFGALSGLVSWLLQDGPNDPSQPKPQTFISRGVQYHFGHLSRDRERSDADPVNPDRVGRDDRAAADLDDEDERPTLTRAVLDTANRLDPSGVFAAAIDLRHGISSGSPLTFEQMGAALRISKQAAQKRYARAVAAVRRELAADRS